MYLCTVALDSITRPSLWLICEDRPCVRDQLFMSSVDTWPLLSLNDPSHHGPAIKPPWRVDPNFVHIRAPLIDFNEERVRSGNNTDPRKLLFMYSVHLNMSN